MTATLDASGSYGYDPARIVALRRRTVEAIESLHGIRCDDPMAADAIRVVRLLCQNLEDSWLPVVEAIHASRAMSTWRRAIGLTTDLHSVDTWSRGALALTELVGQLGARSAWVATCGLDELSDEQLLRRLDDVATRFEELATAGASLGAVWRYLERVSTEAQRRLADDHDGRLAAKMWERLGPPGVARMVSVLDTAGQIADLDLLDGAGVNGHAFGRTSRPLADVLGAMAAHDVLARAAVTDRVTSSTHLAGLMAAHPDAFDAITLVAATAQMVGYVTGTGEWARRPTVIDRNAHTSLLLHAVATSPMHALQLLSHEGTAAAVATAAHLDLDAVEATVAAALSAPMVDPETFADALEVLGGFVATAEGFELNDGARRGVALSLGAFLPSIAPTLDARLPVDVAIVDEESRGSASLHVVHVGSYDQFATLLGQVVHDEPAQLTLGVVVGAFRADQLDLAATAISDRPALDVAGTRAQVSAALADVSRVIHLVDHAVERRDDLLAFRHGVANSQATSVITLLGSMVAWYPPTAPLAGRISTLTTRGVVTAIGSTRPATVPETGLDAHLAIDFLATVIVLPLRDTELRRRLGLSGVSGATWSTLDELLSDLTAAGDDPAKSSRIRSRIRAVADADPELDAYVETLAANSGESALARP
jgi:hypothetical protein